MLKVKPNHLIFLTGLLWLVASYILLSRAYSWAIDLESTYLLIGIILGLVLGFVKSKLIFIKLTNKNIERINAFENKVSLWEFHLNKDKLLIVLMIGIGIVLRQSFIPKWVLMPIYLGIGLAMFLVFLLYMRTFLRQIKRPTS
ncbi:hypothetical protein [Lentimicrobium sp. S6]|uniref:hypothetical protein n=1 Tax=Lentimicrobium sp. S6 TaxID=2735872 RepID=UPI0015565BE4|nr:hypothetical protein [Lentimicrobium sp. S6]NPD45713.1 hypothetical protein [Lentimicrobium sp. S6]